MQDILIVVDMQNDFIDGALGTSEAVAIVPRVLDKIENFGGKIIFTRDTHQECYMDTQEGKNLPVPHCLRGTPGWELIPQLLPYAHGRLCLEKPTFGSVELAHVAAKGNFEEIQLIGLCTDICVISNAMVLKAALPETPISVDASCCAGVTPASHANALEAMKMCQIAIL